MYRWENYELIRRYTERNQVGDLAQFILAQEYVEYMTITQLSGRITFVIQLRKAVMTEYRGIAGNCRHYGICN